MSGFSARYSRTIVTQRAEMVENPIAQPLPRKRAQGEPFHGDPLAMRPHPGGDDHVESGVARRPRHRQAVRAEIPVLGDEKEQLWRGHDADAE